MTLIYKIITDKQQDKQGTNKDKQLDRQKTKQTIR